MNFALAINGGAGADTAFSSAATTTTPAEDKSESNHVKRKLKQRNQGRKLDSHLDEQFATGRLLACLSSRPGQCGRADG